MIFGKYRIDEEWTKDEGFWCRKIKERNPFIQFHYDIFILPNRPLGRPGVDTISFNWLSINNPFLDHYTNIFGQDFDFSSVTKAKERVDLFLDKLSKLKAFI